MIISLLAWFCPCSHDYISALKFLTLLRGCLCCFDIFFCALTLPSMKWCFHPCYQTFILLSSFYPCYQNSFPAVKFLSLLSNFHFYSIVFIFDLMLLPQLCCFIPYFDASIPAFMLLFIHLCFHAYFDISILVLKHLSLWSCLYICCHPSIPAFILPL